MGQHLATCSRQTRLARARQHSAVAIGGTAQRDSGFIFLPDQVDGCDLVLSSGFLAFAYHAGFLEAVAEAGISVRGVMGTSSGALSGSLYCAGYTPLEVETIL